jgi:protein-S-isoprenylcysteine O-methyltransferase Ste14
MQNTPLEHPGVIFPPPLLFALGFGFGWLLHRAAPLALFPGGRSDATIVAGGIVMAIGLVIGAAGLIAFVRHRTAILPMRAAARLVTAGPYQYSRNPMYVGLTVAYVGLVVLTNIAWPLVFLPIVLVALTYLVIRREERYLSGAFDSEYREYTSRVRRWF